MPDRRWGRADTVALLAVTAGAAALRAGFHIQRPARVFDEAYYLTDACRLTGGTIGQCGHAEALSQHPPLGSWLIGLPMAVLEYRPVAGRLAALAAGAATVAALYVLARLLLGSTPAAAMAAGLLGIDFLHFVHSRLAMLDVFLALFTVLAFLCAVLDHGSRAPPAGRGVRPWRLAAGAMAGAAIATKWSGAAVLAALVLLTVAADARRHRSGDSAGTVRGSLAAALRAQGPSLAVAFVALPTVVYLIAHLGAVNGALWAWPWEHGSWFRTFADRQIELASFHAAVGDLGERNPYTSPAWSWPLLKRPVVYFLDVQGEASRRILAMGSPLVWWASLAALAAAATRLVRRRAGGAETVILAGFLATWGPWLLLTGLRDYMFLFYLLPAVPFMCLALGWTAACLSRRLPGRVTVAAFAAAAVVLFGLYQPLLTADPLPERTARRLLLFEHCAPAAGSTPAAAAAEAAGPGPPPPGWCWR